MNQQLKTTSKTRTNHDVGAKAPLFMAGIPLLVINLLFFVILGIIYWFVIQSNQPVNYKITEMRIIPVGDVASSDQEAVLNILQKDFPNTKIALSESIEIPAETYDSKRQQYNAEEILLKLKQGSSDKSIRQIGLINHDIYTPDLNFVFSTTQPKGNTILISLARLMDENDRSETEARYRKVLLRTLGVSFGFKPSSERSCVMAFSNSLEELDAKGLDWCEYERTLQRIKDYK